MTKPSARERLLRITAWFLAITYGAGAVLTVILEIRNQTLSQRFDLPAWIILATCAVQLICAVGVLKPRFAPWAAAALTAITLGAIASHLRIGSPQTAITAVVFTVIQIWFGLASRRSSSTAS